MNTALHILLGLISGSIFYGIVTRFKKDILCKNGILSLLLTVFSFIAASLTSQHNDTLQNMIMYTVLLTLCFESISDIETMHTYTPIIVLTTIFVMVMQMYIRYKEDISLLVWHIILLILVKIICVSLEFTASNIIGGGDLDIYFLIYSSSEIYGLFLILCTTIVFLKHNMLIKKFDVNEPKIIGTDKLRFTNKRIPFVPFLLAGFLFMTLI